jgi:hypothetical protein
VDEGAWFDKSKGRMGGNFSRNSGDGGFWLAGGGGIVTILSRMFLATISIWSGAGTLLQILGSLGVFLLG